MAKRKQVVPKADVDQALKDGTIKPDLEPAGYKRREQLAKRQDELAEAAETMTPNLHTIPDHLLEEDREIQYHLEKDHHHLEVKDGWVVKFVDFVHNNQRAVWNARNEGWIPVSKDMLPKSEHFKVNVEGMVKVGDVLAMAMPREVHEKYLEKQRSRRDRMAMAVDANAQDFAQQHEGIMTFHSSNTETGNPYMDRMRSHSAKHTALTHIGNKMKTGIVPGIPLK